MGQSNWVPAVTVSWYQDALLIKMRLESCGIDAVIPENYTSTIDPAVTGMQVHVLVQEDQLEEARKVLDAPPLPEEPEKCPNCGSTSYRMEGAKGRNFFRSLIGLIFFTPMRRKEVKVCTQCGLRL